MKPGDRVCFLGCSKHQINWGNNDDPNSILDEGIVYTIESVKIHSQHTKIKIIGYEGWFNSVCFIRS